jgi:hypothetical protein
MPPYGAGDAAEGDDGPVFKFKRRDDAQLLHRPRQVADVAQAFGHDAAGFAENRPAIYGWVKRHQHKIQFQ